MVRAEGFFGNEVRWQRLERSRWVRRCRCKTIGQSEAFWDYSWWWGQALHLKRWDQGDSQSFVTRSIAKVFLGSAKTRQAILTKRPTSFWA